MSGSAACPPAEGAGLGWGGRARDRQESLAQAALAAAAEASFGVFSARADELDRGRPFGVVANALGFVPEAPEGSVAVPGLEYRLVDQIVERLEALALKGPAVVGLEDLQWADPGTLVALRALGRRLAHLPLALLGTFRPSPRSAELERLIEDWRGVGALHLVLTGLEHAGVLELAAELVARRGRAPVSPSARAATQKWPECACWCASSSARFRTTGRSSWRVRWRSSPGSHYRRRFG